MDLEQLQMRPVSADWLNNRSTYLGGTDIAAIMGLHPYKTAMSVYLEKKGLATPTELNEPMLHGQNLELYVAQLYSRATGRKLHKSKLYRMKDVPFLAANPDYEVRGERPLRLVECKTAGTWAGQEFGEECDAVPDQYLVQCMWQLAITKREICDLAVLIGGQKFRVYTINRDNELISDLGKRAFAWWQDYILADCPPPLTGHVADVAYIKGKWPESNTDELYACPELEQICKELRDARIANDACAKEVARLSNIIKDEMGNAGILKTSVGNITWKTDANGTRRFCPKFKEASIVESKSAA